MKRLNDLRLPKKESFDHLRKGKNRQEGDGGWASKRMKLTFVLCVFFFKE